VESKVKAFEGGEEKQEIFLRSRLIQRGEEKGMRVRRAKQTIFGKKINKDAKTPLGKGRNALQRSQQTTIKKRKRDERRRRVRKGVRERVHSDFRKSGLLDRLKNYQVREKQNPPTAHGWIDESANIIRKEKQTRRMVRKKNSLHRQKEIHFEAKRDIVPHKVFKELSGM